MPLDPARDGIVGSAAKKAAAAKAPKTKKAMNPVIRNLPQKVPGLLPLDPKTRDGIVGLAAKKAAAAKAPKTKTAWWARPAKQAASTTSTAVAKSPNTKKAMKPVIHSVHLDSN